MDSPPPRAPLWPRLLLTLGPALLLTGYFTIPMGSFGPAHPTLSWTVFGLILFALAGLLLRQIQLIQLESSRGMPALVILLLFCVTLVVFAATYLALSHGPGELKGLSTRIDALYFTVITMSTVGYGDITPTGQVARVVVMVQILYTFVFLTAGATALTQRLRGQIGHRARRRHPDWEGPHHPGPQNPGPPGPDSPDAGPPTRG